MRRQHEILYTQKQPYVSPQPSIGLDIAGSDCPSTDKDNDTKVAKAGSVIPTPTASVSLNDIVWCSGCPAQPHRLQAREQLLQLEIVCMA